MPRWCCQTSPITCYACWISAYLSHSLDPRSTWQLTLKHISFRETFESLLILLVLRASVSSGREHFKPCSCGANVSHTDKPPIGQSHPKTSTAVETLRMTCIPFPASTLIPASLRLSYLSHTDTLTSASAPIKLEHLMPLSYFWLSCAFYAAPACTKYWKRTGGTKQVGKCCATVAETTAGFIDFKRTDIIPPRSPHFKFARARSMQLIWTYAATKSWSHPLRRVDERSLGSFSTGIWDRVVYKWWEIRYHDFVSSGRTYILVLNAVAPLCSST